jgi:murein endopeptidase
MLPKISEGSADASEKAKSHGYYTYKDGDNYLYGRPHIVWNIQKAASNLAAQDIVIGIGDMSKAGGGDIPNHSTHEEGKAADIRLVFSNGSGGGRSRSGDVSELTDADRALNLKVIKELIDADPTNVSDIYVNDKKLQDDINTYLALKTGTNKKIRELGKKITSIFQCRRCDGHNDHIHFEWKE